MSVSANFSKPRDLRVTGRANRKTPDLKAARKNPTTPEPTPAPAKKPRASKPKPPALPAASQPSGDDCLMMAPQKPGPKSGPKPRKLEGDALREHIERLAAQFIEVRAWHAETWKAAEGMEDGLFEQTRPERDTRSWAAWDLEWDLAKAILLLHGKIKSLDVNLRLEPHEPGYQNVDLRASACGVFAAGKYWVVCSSEGNLAPPDGYPVLAMIDPAAMARMDSSSEGSGENALLLSALLEPEAVELSNAIHDRAWARIHAKPAYRVFEQNIPCWFAPSRFTLDDVIAFELREIGDVFPEGLGDRTIWLGSELQAVIKPGPDGKPVVVRLVDPE